MEPVTAAAAAPMVFAVDGAEGTLAWPVVIILVLAIAAATAVPIAARARRIRSDSDH